MFQATLEHEKKVTELIHGLYALASEEKDLASMTMLNWFVNEQVEEEENAADLIFQFEQVEGNKFGHYMMDKELAARVYVVAAPLAGKE